MDIKQTLLLFLYEHKDSGVNVDITPIVKEFDDNRIELMKVVINLGSTDGLISPISNAYTIANKSANEHTPYNQTFCKTRITPTGEKYVQENYLPKQDTIPSIHTHQVVYVGRDNNAPISQADNQSSSRADFRPESYDKEETTISPSKIGIQKLMSQILAWIGKHISQIIIGLIVIYIAYILGWNGIYKKEMSDNPTTDATTELKKGVTK